MMKNIKILFILSIILNVFALGFISERYYYAHIPLHAPHTITYSRNRQTIYSLFKLSNNDIAFAGDSHIEYFDFADYLPNYEIKNRGIAGDISAGLLNRLGPIISGKPQKIFLEIGFNDLTYEITPDSVYKNIALIINNIKKNSPATKIYINSVLPSSSKLVSNVNLKVLTITLNTKIKQLCASYNIPYIDIYSRLSINGYLNEVYNSGDGIHLNGKGYSVWSNVISGYL